MKRKSKLKGENGACQGLVWHDMALAWLGTTRQGKANVFFFFPPTSTAHLYPSNSHTQSLVGFGFGLVSKKWKQEEKEMTLSSLGFVVPIRKE